MLNMFALLKWCRKFCGPSSPRTLLTSILRVQTECNLHKAHSRLSSAEKIFGKISSAIIEWRFWVGKQNFGRIRISTDWGNTGICTVLTANRLFIRKRDNASSIQSSSLLIPAYYSKRNAFNTLLESSSGTRNSN